MSNNFYNHGSFPTTGSAATSASMRAELDAIAAGFDKMPTLTGNANEIVVVNSSGTALTAIPTLPATSGGTGFASYAVGDLLYAATTTALAKLADVVTGNALISGGVGVAPSWGKIGLTTHVTGTLPATNGGTGFASYAVGDLLFASTTTALSALADVATGNALISGGVGVAPSYGKIGLTTHVSGTLPTANGGTNLTSFTANGIVYASSTSALATGSALTFDGSTLATTGALTVDGNTTLGNASTDTVTVNGYIGVGGAGNVNNLLRVTGSGSFAGADQSGGVFFPTGTTSGTSEVSAVLGAVQTAASAYTVTNVVGLKASNAVKGAGSTITNQHGLYVADQTQGTNNYGITSLVSSGTNKWNIYASGTAANYFAGNVGIGVTTPSYLLSLYGATSQIQFVNVNTGTTASDGLTIGMGGSSSTDAYINQRENANLIFNTNATERMRLDSAGNLGLGVVPSAWGTSVFNALQVRNGAIWGDVRSAQSGNTFFGGNTFFDGTNYKYITTNAAGYMSVSANSGGQFAWFQAPSGTAGNAITFTQAMTLDASGRLLVGATSVRSGQGYPLYVETTSVTGGFFARNSADATGTVMKFAKSRATAVGGVTAVTTNDTLGDLYFSGTDGTGLLDGARIIAAVDGTVTTGGMPTRLAFSTSAAGSSSPTERLRIDSSGNVSIGTSSPLVAAGFTTVNVYNATTGAIYRALSADSTADGRLQVVNGAVNIGSYTNVPFLFNVNGTERMRIDSSGNVGIGTSSPAYKLDVAGAISTNNNLTFTGTGNRITGDFSNATVANRVMFQTSTANANTNLGVIPNGTAVGVNSLLFNNSDPTNAGFANVSINTSAVSFTSGITGTGTYVPMTFFTGGSERMRVDTSGNVGIGTSSPAAKLNVYDASNALIAAQGDAATSVLAQRSSNDIFSSALTMRKTRGTVAAQTAPNSGDTIGIVNYQVFGGTNNRNLTQITSVVDTYTSDSNISSYLFFATSPSGSAAATERARIDSSGNLLIGTTTATSNSRFKVQGSSTSGSDHCAQFTKSNGDNILFLKNDGSTIADGVYNSTTANAANVYISGSAQLQRSTSSLKYKTDVQNAVHGLAEVMALRPVTYKGKNDGNQVFGGLIAEEVHEAGLTEFVQYADDGSPDALAYGNMVSLCIKAIQEMKVIIDAQADRIAALEAK